MKIIDEMNLKQDDVMDDSGTKHENII